MRFEYIRRRMAFTFMSWAASLHTPVFRIGCMAVAVHDIAEEFGADGITFAQDENGDTVIEPVFGNQTRH